MEARVNVNLESINVIPGKKYKMSDIARIANVPYCTARVALIGDSPKIGHNTRAKIREIAEYVGFEYKPVVRTYSGYDGNFPSKADEIDKMLQLREKGYTNKEIAKMVGRHYTTVLSAIGKQPEAMTMMTMALVGEATARRNNARKNLVLDGKIERIKVLQMEVDEQAKQAERLQADANRAMLEAQRLMDQAKEKQDRLNGKVIELKRCRKEAEKAAKALGRILA